MAYTITRGARPAAKKVVLYGPEGIGKTTFAAHFPDPLFIDTEGGSDPYDLARLPAPESWQMLAAELRQVLADPGCCRTLVLDTLDWAERLCRDDLLARTKKTSIEAFGYGKGYVYLAEEFGRLLGLLEQIRGEGIHVVCTAHAALRKFEQPDELGSYDRWELKLTKNVTPLVKEWADLLLFANYKTVVVRSETGKDKAQGGSRVLYTSHHPCWDAKNRYGLPEEMPFAYEPLAGLFAPMQAQAAAQDDGTLITMATQPAAAPAAGGPAEAPAPAPPPAALAVSDAEPAPTPPPAPAPAPAPAVPEGFAVLPVSGNAEEASLPYLLAAGVPETLARRMAEGGVSEQDLTYVVGTVMGILPADLPLRSYPPDAVQDMLDAWDTVLAKVHEACDDLPF